MKLSRRSAMPAFSTPTSGREITLCCWLSALLLLPAIRLLPGSAAERRLALAALSSPIRTRPRIWSGWKDLFNQPAPPPLLTGWCPLIT
uniref:Secreted protein n=1 Tax=Macrostomum lignano TaxID=282301 RepID=A0A1I8FQS4_9PLAT